MSRTPQQRWAQSTSSLVYLEALYTQDPFMEQNPAALEILEVFNHILPRLDIVVKREVERFQ